MRGREPLRTGNKSSSWLWVLALAAGLALSTTALGQEVVGGQGSTVVAVPTRVLSPRMERISVDFTQTPLSRVVEVIAKQTGKNIVLDKGIEDTVTLNLMDVPWLDALKLIADQAGCVVELQGENIYRMRKPPRITMEFRDADLKAAIDILAAQSGANVIVAEDVQGKVNLRLKSVPWKQALEQVVKTHGYAIVEEEGGLMRVISRSQLAEQLETWMFPLRYLRPPSTYVALIETPYAAGAPKPFDMAQLEKEFGVFRAVKSALSANGKMDYVPETNTLIVTETVPKLKEIERIVQEMDRTPGQVFVQVRFVTTTNTDILNYGVKWAQGLAITQTLGSMVTKLPFEGGSSGWEKGISALGDPYTATDVTDYLADADKTAFTFGSLDFTQTSMLVEMIQKDTNSKIVQSPVLTVLDNQPATIFSGERIRWAETEAATAQAGGLEFSIREAGNSPVDTGFQLLIIPHIIRDSDDVLMTIIPAATSLSGRSTEQPGFDVFSIGEQEIALPRVASRTVVTQMILQSAHTAVIGGLADKTESETVTRVPFLGYIPVLGWLFRHKGTTETDSTLLILISVDVLENAQKTTAILTEDWSPAVVGLMGTAHPEAAPAAAPAAPAASSE